MFCEFNGERARIVFYVMRPSADEGVHRVMLGRVCRYNNSYAIVQEHHGAIEYPHSNLTLGRLFVNCFKKMFGLQVEE